MDLIMNINKKIMTLFLSVIFFTCCVSTNFKDIKNNKIIESNIIFQTPEENIKFFMQNCLNQNLNNIKKCFKESEVINESYFIKKEDVDSFSYFIKSITIYDKNSLKELKQIYKFLFDFKNSPQIGDAGIIVSEKYIINGERRDFDFYYLLRKINNNWLIINNVALYDFE